MVRKSVVVFWGMVASLVFIFSCGGRGGGGIQEEEWVNLSKGYINGVVKEYSRYHVFDIL